MTEQMSCDSKAGTAAFTLTGAAATAPRSASLHSALQVTPSGLSSRMSSSLALYESFLLKNVSTISSLESSLRSVTWFLPGRFKDAELASEALSAFLNAVSMYHDTLLARIVNSDPKFKPLIPTSLHSRYTRAWSDRDAFYKWIARTLELIKFTELLLEMTLRRKVQSKTKWRGIVLLETVKAMLRLTLLRITRRPLLSPPVPERDIDPAAIPDSAATSPTLAPSSPSISPPATPDHLKNNHTPLPPHPLITPPPPSREPDTSIEDFLLPKALTTASVKPPLSLIRSLASPRDWLSETLYIIRPLVYAVMLSRDKKTNRPLATILIMELLSRSLRRSPSTNANLERSEYARRDRDMLWYLFRGAIWQDWTRPKLESFTNSTSRVPGVGLLSAFIQDWVPLIDEYYYYTAP